MIRSNRPWSRKALRELKNSPVGGPFGEQHLSMLAECLDRKEKPKHFFWPIALMRNLLLYPIVLAHGFRRIVPY
jgi:hypothetical protein